MKKIITLFTIFILTSAINAQKITGKITDEKDKPIPFANIDILKKDELLKTVYTNFDGEFSIKLNAGEYLLKIQHVSFWTHEENISLIDSLYISIQLKTDESAHEAFNEVEVRALEEIKVKSSHDAEYSVPLIDRDGGASGTSKITKSEVSRMPTRSGAHVLSTTSGASTLSSATKSSSTVTYKDDIDKSKGAKSGVLTAGEINDFSKWELWTDLTKDELKIHKGFWGIEVNGRYSVQLQNRQGFPIVDSKVNLVDKTGNIIYEARTDNTGKTELWSSILPKQSQDGSFSIVVKHKDISKRIKKAITFEEGINDLIIDTECSENKNIDIAFVVDATGSMGDEIEFLKAELNNVMFEAKGQDETLNMRFANVFYRDHGDEYLTKTMGFSHILSESTYFIKNQKANGGGDYEEAVEIGLDTAINQLKWSDDALSRILFLILDAPPHNNDKVKASLENSMRKAAAKGIRIIPLVASGINKNAEYLMRNLALATNGTYAFLTNHSGVGNNHIEPSTDSYEVELLKDLLIRVIENYTYVPSCEEDNKEKEEQEWSQIEDQKDQLQWKYWPNPTNGIIQVECEKDIEELQVTDLTGKLLQRQTNLKSRKTYTLDLSLYSSGVYIVKGKIGADWISTKIVLNRT